MLKQVGRFVSMATKTVKENMTYKVQIDDLVRDATAEEVAAIELQKAQFNAEKAEAQAKATAKTALLERLGITEDEAQLLLS